MVYEDGLKHYTWSPQRIHHSYGDSNETRWVQQIVEWTPNVEEGRPMQLVFVQLNLARTLHLVCGSHYFHNGITFVTNNTI
jgi:hypothetical protein